MAAVREVKSAPLLRCQGTQNRMLGDGNATRKLRLALGDDLVHAVKIFQQVEKSILRRHVQEFADIAVLKIEIRQEDGAGFFLGKGLRGGSTPS